MFTFRNHCGGRRVRAVLALAAVLAVATTLLPTSARAQSADPSPELVYVATTASADGLSRQLPVSIGGDNDGNSYVAGNFSRTADFDGDLATLTDQRTAGSASQVNGFGLFVLSHDPNGVLRWVITVDGTGGHAVRDLAVDAAGNSYIAGTFTGMVDFDGDLTTLDDQRIANSSGSPAFADLFA